MLLESPLFSPDTRGRTPLWIVFWVYGVLASHLLFGTMLTLYARVSTPVFGALTAVFVLYTAGIMRLIWINAFNVRNEWLTHVSRALTVVWVLNALLVSVFLFLGHAAGQALPL